MSSKICTYDGECPFKVSQGKDTNCSQKAEGEEITTCGMRGNECPHLEIKKGKKAGNFEPEETVWSILK